MNKEMTICECCEAISELTHDEAINEILNYIEEKAGHMSKKLAERKQQLKQADYELAETCIYLEQHIKALDKACVVFSNTNLKTTCGDYFKECKENYCIGENCIYSRPLTKEEWKEWLMKDE